MSSPKFRVAICGGGISGLCLAVALSKYHDIQVDVYEAAGRFKEIGAGVMIWEKTWRILEIMGLASEFSRIAHAPPDGSIGVGFDYRRSDQPTEGFRFHLVEMPYGCIRFHRAHFLDVFVDNLPDGVAHFGKRLTSYTQSTPAGPILLRFGDSSTATCDLLVGCDGIKSLIRAQMLGARAKQDQRPDLLDYIEPIWSGTIAYRGLIPVEDLNRGEGKPPHRAVDVPMMYCGKSKHVVSYSISQGSVVNIVALNSQPEKEGMIYDDPWVIDCAQEEVLECFAGWEPEVHELLKCIEKPTKWGLHQLKPLPFFVVDKVALIGDAAHAMVPHQGAGAGQAIEDAFILAYLLSHPSTTLETLPYALLAYQDIRLPTANHVLRGSHESGMMYEFNSEFGDQYNTLGPAIENQWSWVWETTPEQDCERALESMRRRAVVH